MLEALTNTSSMKFGKLTKKEPYFIYFSSKGLFQSGRQNELYLQRIALLFQETLKEKVLSVKCIRLKCELNKRDAAKI